MSSACFQFIDVHKLLSDRFDALPVTFKRQNQLLFGPHSGVIISLILSQERAVSGGRLSSAGAASRPLCRFLFIRVMLVRELAASSSSSRERLSVCGGGFEWLFSGGKFIFYFCVSIKITFLHENSFVKCHLVFEKSKFFPSQVVEG